MSVMWMETAVVEASVSTHGQSQARGSSASVHQVTLDLDASRYMLSIKANPVTPLTISCAYYVQYIIIHYELV